MWELGPIIILLELLHFYRFSKETFKLLEIDTELIVIFSLFPSNQVQYSTLSWRLGTYLFSCKNLSVFRYALAWWCCVEYALLCDHKNAFLLKTKQVLLFRLSKRTEELLVLWLLNMSLLFWCPQNMGVPVYLHLYDIARGFVRVPSRPGSNIIANNC